MLALLSGLGLGLSLIVAIGAQNVFLLRQGLRREHVLPVVLICAVSDAVLIVAGVGGLGFLVERAPWLIPAARCAGAVFLLAYGLLAARRAWRGGTEALEVDESAPPVPPLTALVAADRLQTASVAGEMPAERQDTSAASGPHDTGSPPPAARTRSTRIATVATVLALTWLNPHVYLDTVLLLGSVAATHGDERWLFAAGAVTASFLWFTALGFGARYLGRWLRTSRAWRMLDAAIAVIMIALGAGLVLPLLG